MMKRSRCFLIIPICVLMLTGCRQKSGKGLFVLQNRIERTSILCGKDIDTSFVLCKKEMEKRLFVVEKEAQNNPIFQQVENVAVPEEVEIKAYLNMTISEIERLTGNTMNEEENITVFSVEESYKGLYLDNTSFYFLCKEDKTVEKPNVLTFYGKYYNEYLETIELSKDMGFKEIMAQWGEAELEESRANNEHYYRIQYERKGLIYSFVSDNKEGESFRTYIELSDDLNADLYDKYLRKIWMPQEWGENVHLIHDTGFSISIYEMEGNVVKGKISTKSLVELPCSNYSLREYQYPVFSGTISGNTIEGNFCDEYGNEGKLRLVLKDENAIEAAFEYVNKDLDEELLALNGNYILRPYNMKDENQVTMNRRDQVNLNWWGYVYLTVGKLDTGRGTVGTAFLTDSEGNIFYKFGLPFRHGTEIRHGYVEDINGDGLRDVVLVEFFGIDNKNNKEWIILQRKDGLFYSDVLKE